MFTMSGNDEKANNYVTLTTHIKVLVSEGGAD